MLSSSGMTYSFCVSNSEFCSSHQALRHQFPSKICLLKTSLNTTCLPLAVSKLLADLNQLQTTAHIRSVDCGLGLIIDRIWYPRTYASKSWLIAVKHANQIPHVAAPPTSVRVPLVFTTFVLIHIIAHSNLLEPPVGFEPTKTLYHVQQEK